MKIGQIKAIIDAFNTFTLTVCEARAESDLQLFSEVLTADGIETTASFVNRIKKNVSTQRLPGFPTQLALQLKSLRDALSEAGAGAASRDIEILLGLNYGPPASDTASFVANLIAARDFVAPVKMKSPAKAKTNVTPSSGVPVARPKKSKAPKAADVIASYVHELTETAIKPTEFSIAFERLKADVAVTETSLKKVAKALSQKSASSREEAFSNILSFQNRKARQHSSKLTLDQTPV